METEPIWIGSTYCTSSRINTLVLTLLAPKLSAAMHKAAPSPELCLALGLDDTTAAYDFAVIQVNKAGGITIIDAYQDAKIRLNWRSSPQPS